MRRVITLLLAIIFFLPCSVLSQDRVVRDWYVPVYTVGESITIGWDAETIDTFDCETNEPITIPAKYLVEMFSPDRNMLYAIARTDTNQATFTPDIGGTYIFRVYSYMIDCNGEEVKSDNPSLSIDKSVAILPDGTPREWAVFFKTPVPEEVIIE